MAADYSRIHRLLKILNLVQSEPSWNAGRLAEECGTTKRTIYRDIDMLKAAGIPVSHDPERNCYSVSKDFFMPPVELTFDEALALTALGKHLGNRDGEEQIPFTRKANNALAKVRSVLPRRVQDELSLIHDHIAVKLAATSEQASEDVYEKVRRSITSKRAMRCKYESLAAGENGHGGPKKDETFVFKPYTLLFSQRAWYVIGYHGNRDAVRTLKLNRFTMCELTDLAYSIPKDFSVEDHLGNAWRMIKGNKAYNVALQFDANFAETIADTTWHRTQESNFEPDGSLNFTCTVDGLEEIVWWVLSMGSHCVVKSPPELVQRVRDEVAKMQAQYGESKPGKAVVKKPSKGKV